MNLPAMSMAVLRQLADPASGRSAASATTGSETACRATPTPARSAASTTWSPTASDPGRRWLREAGAHATWRVQPHAPALSGGQHQAGTARMAEAPSAGATDPDGRVWGTERIYIADASLHVTNGGANPVPTIMALAWRTAAHIAT
jgi:choline dehydrogenase-like flavoprotein